MADDTEKQEDFKIVYITDLDNSNYEGYVHDIFLSIYRMKEIFGMSLDSLARLFGILISLRVVL